MGRLSSALLIDKLTATRQFSCLPTCPQYWRVTPTECVPFHDAVLDQGPLPLDLLEAKINAWIATQK
jgi:hypothetical protein